jgi:adenosylcobinamide-GDP ribazoletransferase
MKALGAELVAAFMLLTRFPLGRLGRVRAEDAFAGAVWAYPIVGLVIGAVGAGVYAACTRTSVPPLLRAIFCLGAMVLATGGLHEDALADTADGLGGGRTRARKLEIMRDSRVGTFGVLALAFTLATRGAAVVSLGSAARVAAALIAAGGLGRGAMLVPLLVLEPAHTDGLAAGLRTSTSHRLLAGLLIAGAIPLLLLPIVPALDATAAALIVALAASFLARRQIGGYTGDLLGATEIITECAVVAVLAWLGTSSAR